MSQNTGELNWHGLVEEALRRRKAEGLTQREHAALAGVSVPTLAAFDRGEHTLTLAKAFDILRVVGLLREPTEGGAQAAFVRESLARWRSLVDHLPEDAPARFPHGSYRIDYCLEGELSSVSLTTFEEMLRKAVPRHTGWPTFIFMTNDADRPREVEDAIECWLGRKEERVFSDAAHMDYWRALPTGRFLLMRGYQEDGQDTFAPGAVFDTTLPIWRLGEALVHADSMAKALRRKDDTPITIKFRVVYSGLAGRVLRSWANPMSDLFFEGHAARSDEAVLEAEIPAGNVSADMARHLYPMIASLYERFGVAGLSIERVAAETDRFLKSRMR